MNELDLYLENRFDGYYTEMKTREEYAIRKFKKKYDYDPKTKTIKGPDGERIEVDIDTKNPKMKITNAYGNKVDADRMTSSDKLSVTPKISLDSRFFKLKNQKRRDAILHHEIGHTKLHSPNTSKPELKTRSVGNDIADEVIDDLGKIYKKRGLANDDDIDKMKQRGSLKIRKDQIIKKYEKDMDENKKSSKLRKSSYEKFKKDDEDYKYYKPRKSNTDEQNKKENRRKPDNMTDPHTSAKEFEADRYAANKTSKSELKKAIREGYKMNKKKTDKDRMYSDKIKKQFRIQGENNIKIRSKILDSNHLTNDEKENYK